jgi:hypothetical protein
MPRGWPFVRWEARRRFLRTPQFGRPQRQEGESGTGLFSEKAGRESGAALEMGCY